MSTVGKFEGCIRRSTFSQLSLGLAAYRMSFVYRQTVLRCLLKRPAMERTLSPFALAVLIASTSSGVGRVLGGLFGSVMASKPCSRCAVRLLQMPSLA